ERESRRIDLPVTRGAHRVGAVLIQLLPDRDRAADVRFNGGNTWWRGGPKTENALHDPHAAKNRRRGRAVRGYFEDTRLRHESTAHGIFRQCDLPHGDSRHAGYAVMSREALIQKSEVRIDDVPRGKILIHQFLDEETRFFDGGEFQRVV